MGACPECDGLGQITFFDPKRVVAHPSLSLAAGAVKGWDRRNQFYFQMLQSLAAFYDFDIDTAVEDLPEKVRKILLFGSGKQQIPFSYINERGPHVGPRARVRRHHPESGAALPRNGFGRGARGTRQVPEQSAVPCLRGHAAAPRSAASCRIGADGDARGIYEISGWPLRDALGYFQTLRLEGSKREIADKVVKEIVARLMFLNNVGLDYLSLERSAETLSGGEAQRIRLASQIGSGLTGVMYVLDEPSIGLHQRDNDRLIATLKHLRDLGNSVIVVEHDEDMIRMADYVVDMGPGAGEHGGMVIAEGTPKQVQANAASDDGAVHVRRAHHRDIRTSASDPDERHLRIVEAHGNNLRHVTLDLPVGLLTCVTGVSGSGKSTLINDTLYHAVAHHLYGSSTEPAPYESIEGLEHFDKVINVDQSPIGRTPRSNPATYTGLFTPIRELFAGVPAAKERGYDPGRFSFNVKGGRCESCQGDGVLKVEMHFLPDVYVPCDVCHGKRYNRETLDVQYKGKNISEVLDMTVEQAYEFFRPVPVVARKLKTLARRGPRLYPAGPVGDHAVGRRGAARQTISGTEQARHRSHAIHSRRTHDRVALP